MFTSIYCGQVYNIYNYTKQHLYIYTCTRVYINIYMYTYKRDRIIDLHSLTFKRVRRQPPSKYLKDVKRCIFAVGKKSEIRE